MIAAGILGLLLLWMVIDLQDRVDRLEWWRRRR
ncbi:hypothetical protein SEA_RASPUTIA_34 [Microbacterium phage Rasputia]|nr:hypothetical protein SEA_RASPUTIA_34 [Microbacterium phage Rasputia]